MLVPIGARLVHRCAAEISPFLARCSSHFMSRRLSRPVFLIGCGRSGTTLLNNLLRVHRDIACWSEANEILDSSWYPRPKRGAYRAPMEYDPIEFTRDWWHQAKARQARILACFGAYQWVRRKPVFVNKSPFNTFRIPHLLEMLPSAKFVHIARDGRAVVYSYARKFMAQRKFQEWPEPQRSLFESSFDELAIWLANFWRVSYEEVRRQDRMLQLTERGILLEVSYEELCGDTQLSLDRICQFIDVDARRFPKRIDANIAARNSRWQDSLAPSLVSRMVEAMQPTLHELHYI